MPGSLRLAVHWPPYLNSGAPWSWSFVAFMPRAPSLLVCIITELHRVGINRDVVGGKPFRNWSPALGRIQDQ
jgi:hypothetical protein